MNYVKLFIGLFQWACMFLSFLYSLSTINNVNSHRYLRYFFLYSGLALLTSSLTCLHDIFGLFAFRPLVVMHFYSIFAHLFLLSYFFFHVFDRKIFRAICLFIVLIASIISFFQIRDSLNGSFTSYSFVSANLTLIIFCLLYYYQMISGKPVENLFSIPAFWIVTGIFMCMSLVVLSKAIGSYFGEVYGLKPYNFFNVISALAYAGMHIFFIIAYRKSLLKV